MDLFHGILDHAHLINEMIVIDHGDAVVVVVVVIVVGNDIITSIPTV